MKVRKFKKLNCEAQQVSNHVAERRAVCQALVTGPDGNKRLSPMLVIMFAVMMLTLTACGKENKYVNMGVQMSTDGISLCLTGYTNSLQSVSNYVFFSGSSEETIAKITEADQNIDISYLPAAELGRISPDMDVKVVFIDCLNTDGSLRGVWIAREEWMTDAPTYSQKFIDNLVKCADYRASHLKMTYAEAEASVQGDSDPDFSKYDDVMQFCAIYAISNREKLVDNAYSVMSVRELDDMFSAFESGNGDGYLLCREAYDRYCSGTADVKSFEDMFDLSLMQKATDNFLRL